ncbi:30S ribosomal protein S17 [Wenzhouxiangella sp. EGI_FJ10409]|uniref:30S ribosomal protein S17 n=1 Tax=Wenzhouxiangella sp. EGI_FJ10409 TaxID=3243767 RepID=UPI0035DE30C8
MSSEDRKQRSVVGRVVSNRMDKTVTVRLERLVKHPLYGKYVRRSSKVHAHDADNSCNEGDTVRIEQTRPISKTKAWQVIEVVERAQ